ncbi:MAG: PA2779 family protein [Deltaproteobacteria bacterium]|nr:PA2779 family protein [Deltaproteobacteria bacterium]
MTSIRKAGWFFMLACAMAAWTGVLGSIRGEAVAGMIASHAAGDGVVRGADLGKVQSFLEKKIVAQKLRDYGVSAEEAMAKVRSMSDRDLHRLASLTDRAAAGADDGIGLLIAVAVLIILIIVIFKLMNKEIIVR